MHPINTINNLTVTRNTYTCATSEVSRHSGIRHTPVTHAICGTLCLWLFHPACSPRSESYARCKVCIPEGPKPCVRVQWLYWLPVEAAKAPPNGESKPAVVKPSVVEGESP